MAVMRDLVKEFIDRSQLVGEGFDDTPTRVENFWNDFLYQEQPICTSFRSDNKEMITLKDYKCWGFCPHHLLPVQYTFKVSYLPDGRVLGLSKLIRVINYLLKDLPIQEDLPTLIVNFINSKLAPKGVACRVEGFHLCMAMRGVKSEATVVTTALKGCFVDDPSAKEEFLKA